VPVSKALTSSDRQDWRTPQVVIDAMKDMGTISLDPCPSICHDDHFALVNLCQCHGNDGLAATWKDHALVYVNPPYGREIAVWVERCWAQHIKHDVSIVALVPARTDTAWWQAAWRSATAVCFWRGRLKFVGAPSSAPFPSALIYWGSSLQSFCDAFTGHGQVVRP
jgi:phage N-6-adenine-methyltransferase